MARGSAQGSPSILPPRPRSRQTESPSCATWRVGRGNVWRVQSRKLRLVAGLAALGIFGVAGCTQVTGGTATVDASDVPDYRSSVTASESAASATSSARESQRQASLTTEAVHTVCETLATRSADAVKTVNAYVEAVNNGGDVAGAKQPAVDALNSSADDVSRDMNDALPTTLRTALQAWVDASHAAAGAVGKSAGEFNTAVNHVNDTRTEALTQCDAAYR